MKINLIFLLLIVFSCNSSKEEKIDYYWKFQYVTQDGEHNLILDKNYKFDLDEMDTIKKILDEGYHDWAINKKGELYVSVSSVSYSDMFAIISIAKHRIKRSKHLQDSTFKIQ